MYILNCSIKLNILQKVFFFKLIKPYDTNINLNATVTKWIGTNHSRNITLACHIPRFIDNCLSHLDDQLLWTSVWLYLIPYGFPIITCGFVWHDSKYHICVSYIGNACCTKPNGLYFVYYVSLHLVWTFLSYHISWLQTFKSTITVWIMSKMLLIYPIS